MIHTKHQVNKHSTIVYLAKVGQASLNQPIHPYLPLSSPTHPSIHPRGREVAKSKGLLTWTQDLFAKCSLSTTRIIAAPRPTPFFTSEECRNRSFQHEKREGFVGAAAGPCLEVVPDHFPPRDALLVAREAVLEDGACQLRQSIFRLRYSSIGVHRQIGRSVGR